MKQRQISSERISSHLRALGPVPSSNVRERSLLQLKIIHSTSTPPQQPSPITSRNLSSSTRTSTPPSILFLQYSLILQIPSTFPRSLTKSFVTSGNCLQGLPFRLHQTTCGPVLIVTGVNFLLPQIRTQLKLTAYPEPEGKVFKSCYKFKEGPRWTTILTRKRWTKALL